MSFKIAYCAGHYIDTPGKRASKSLDKNQTREWVLNDRVADHFAKAAAEYEGVELLRTDDSTGKKFIDIPDRVKKANKWGADIYIDMHHNAGIGGGQGGGIIAFSYPGSKKGREYRDAIYEACIAAGGLKGNRSKPKQEKAFDSLSLTKMPAVLMEYGFMDSKTDAPVILTDSYSKLVAYATMEAIAKVANLKKVEVKPAAKPATKTEKPKASYSLKQFVKDVQKACGAEVDGIAGPETIGKTVTVSADENDTHKVVKYIQKRLMALGYAQVGAADGIAGPKFTSAVKAFQKDNDCTVDGEITAGQKTWHKLLGMK